MATLLTTSFKLLANVKSSTYSNFRLYGKYNSQSAETNKSSITLETRIYGNGGAGSFGSGTSKINSTSKSLGNTSYEKGNETVLQTLTYEVEHSSTGTYENKTVTANLTTSATPKGSISTQISLPTIPRASTLSVSNSLPYIGDNITIAINKKNDNYIHDLNWKTADDELSGVIATKTTENSIIWTIPEEIYDIIPDSRGATTKLYLTTYNADGDTQIGETYEYSIACMVNPETNKPDVSYTITETNEKVIAVSDKLILNASMPKFNITASAKKGSSISSIIVTNEDGQSYSGEETTFKEIGTSKFTITVTDSRGIANVINLDLSTQDIDYIKPNIKKLEADRKSPTSGNVILNASGDFYNGEFSSETGDNFLDISYRFKENVSDSTWSELVSIPNDAISFDDNSYSITDYDLGAITEYNKNYVFEFYYSDALFDNSVPTSRIVKKGITIYNYGEHDLTVNGDLFVADEDGKNKVNVLDEINNIKNNNNVVYEITLTEDTDIIEVNGLDMVSDGGEYEFEFYHAETATGDLAITFNDLDSGYYQEGIYHSGSLRANGELTKTSFFRPGMDRIYYGTGGSTSIAFPGVMKGRFTFANASIKKVYFELKNIVSVLGQQSITELYGVNDKNVDNLTSLKFVKYNSVGNFLAGTRLIIRKK